MCGLTDVVCVAVEDGLVRADGFADPNERLDDPQTKLATLRGGRDSNILNVADQTSACGKRLHTQVSVSSDASQVGHDDRTRCTDLG